jgi:uncharacterized membrane protein YdjX (TVP38/TMEM64 family)
MACEPGPQEAPQGQGPAHKKAAGKARVAQIIVLVSLVLVTIWLFTIRDQLTQYSELGYTGIFLFTLASNATLIFPLPGPLAALAGGSLFDPVIVAVVAASGATLGEMTGYLAGFTGKHLVEPRPRLVQIKTWIERYRLVPIFVLAAVPNPFFDLAGVLAGMLRIPLTHFLLVTWAGKLAKFLAFAFLGAKLVVRLGS